MAIKSDTLKMNGEPIRHCIFDAQTYRNSSSSAQEYGRWALRNSSAIVMVPAAPLRGDATYKVEITVNGRAYAWQFSIAN